MNSPKPHNHGSTRLEEILVNTRSGNTPQARCLAPALSMQVPYVLIPINQLLLILHKYILEMSLHTRSQPLALLNGQATVCDRSRNIRVCKICCLVQEVSSIYLLIIRLNGTINKVSRSLLTLSSPYTDDGSLTINGTTKYIYVYTRQ